MKIRAIISGPSVHNVRYRVYLLKMALTEGVEGFSATNMVGPDDIQQVLVLAEGDEEAICDFSSLIKTSTPPHATVVSVDIEPYSKRIIRIMDFLHLIQVEQLDKGIPAILSIQSSQEKMLEKQDQTIGEIKALRSDLKTEMNDRFNRMEQELRTIKEALHRSGIMA
jgi:acylphosphatase